MGLKRLGEFGQKGVAIGGDGDAVSESGGGVEVDAEALAGLVGAGKVGVGPLGVLAHKLDVGIARLGHLGQALLEGQIVEDGPEHDGKRKRRGLR